MTDKIQKFIEKLQEHATWASYNEWDVPITLGEDIDAAADLIESLAAELEQVKRERDTAVEDLTESAPCFACKNFRRNEGGCKGAKSCLWAMIECEEFGEEYTGMTWQWRGVTKEEADE